MSRINTVMGTLLLLGSPWMGLWDSDRSAAAVGFSAANMALAPLVCLLISALGQFVTTCVARLLGDRVVTVLLGLGPQLFGLRISSTFVSLRAFPFAGFNVIVTTRKRGQTARALVATLACIASLTALLIAVVCVRDASWTSLKQGLATGIAWDMLIVIACASGLLWSVNAIESTFKEEVRKARRALGYAASAQRYEMDGAYDLAIAEARRGLEDSPDNLMLLLVVATSTNAKGEDALTLVEPLLSRNDVSAYLKPVVLNLWAWVCLVRGDDNLRAAADDASREALAAHPKSASLLDTRGHVLLWNGRHDEAEVHLKRAYELADRDSTYASAAAGLAMLCTAKDRPEEAAMWLQRGRDHDPDNVMMVRAVAAVEPLRRT
jgi:hypothetical protein